MRASIKNRQNIDFGASRATSRFARQSTAKPVAVRWMSLLGVFGIFLGGLGLGLISARPTRSAQERFAGEAGADFVVNGTEADVVQIVKAISGDSVIRGTYVYERDKVLSGAVPADSSAYFGPWKGTGHVFYKVLKGALAPRHFKESGDVGTITVRYVVQALGESRTRVQIEAVFVEDGSRKVDASDRTVESSEFKEIQDRLRQVQLADQEAAAVLRQRQEEDDKKADLLRQRQEETVGLESAESSVKDLDSKLRELRRQIEVKVRNEGTELKSAPFHSAVKMQSLAAGAELVVLIITPSWYGVETPDGHRGWIPRNQVESLP